MLIKERYRPVAVGVNATVPFTFQTIGGFLCLTSGTLTVTREDGGTLFTGLPVTAGQFVRIPFYIGARGGTVTTASNASGILAA